MTYKDKYAAARTPARALFLSLWIVIFIVIESCSLLLSPSEMTGALFQLGTMFPYFVMTIGYFNLFRDFDRSTMINFGVINTLGIAIQLCSIPELFEIHPDVRGYEIGQILAESLMCIAIFMLAWVLTKTPFIPRIFAYGYVIFGIFWALALWLWIAYPARSIFDPPTYISGWIAQGGLAIYLAIYGIRYYRNAANS